VTPGIQTNNVKR